MGHIADKGIKKLYGEVKNLRSLRSNAACLREEIDRVKGIEDDIKTLLSGSDKHLKTKDSDFPTNGELGELPGALVQPIENELVGKFVHEKLQKLETWLLKDDSVRVVGVYGMPGVGKTSLLKHINNNEKVVNFFKLVIWVTASRDSDISDLQRRICERIELPWRPNLSIDKAAGLLQTVFKERKLLLILKDVWKRIDVSK
ncbi:hypothetical protein SUGI_0133940 [Cryptomeria japonica]|nr:hypothetical protein SUGI_0133940 [Cryptomeria japonica]